MTKGYVSVAVICCLFGLLFMQGCNKSSTPDGAVEAFFAEVNKGNFEPAKSFFSNGSWDEASLRKVPVAFPVGSIDRVWFTDLNIDGEKAKLDVHVYKKDGVTYSTNLQLVKQGAAWKIFNEGIYPPFGQ